MTDPVDDFGAGIPTLPTQQPVATPPVMQTDPVQDSFFQQFSSRFQVPEGITADKFDDYLVKMSEEATAAEELRTKYATLEAQIAASARTPEVQPSAAGTPAQQVAAQRRWEAEKVDQQFASFVKPDPSGYGYIPLQAGNITHIRAADAMNQKAMRDQEFSRAFLEDPYATAEELVDARFRAMEEKFQKELEATRSQFTPIQEQIAMSAVEQEQRKFEFDNREKLYTETGEFTPLGDKTDWLMRNFPGTAAEVAMAKAAELLGQVAPAAAAPVRTAPLSKVAQQQPAKPARFVDNLSQQSRMPIDHPEFAGGNGKKRKTIQDLNKEFGITPANN